MLFDSYAAYLKAKLILPHVGLVALTVTYTIIGAALFYFIEAPYENYVKNDSLHKIYSSRQEFLEELWELSQNNGTAVRADFMTLGWNRIENMTDMLFNSFDKHMLTSAEIRNNESNIVWNFPAAIFFAVTVVTTIGYGNPVPLTFTGRLICVLYALFGIPLTLVTVADVGKFCGEHLISIYTKCRALAKKIRRAYCNRFAKSSILGEPADAQPICDSCRFNENIYAFQDQRIPATIVIAILIGYTALGGLLLQKLELWEYFDAFYFSFITMTTIGFGDLVPRKNGYLFLILMYIIVGLAITTMCIDIVGVQYIQKIHYFGRKIQDARTALAFVGGKAVYIQDLFNKRHAANNLRRQQVTLTQEGFFINGRYLGYALIPFIPRDIKRIRYIDESTDSIASTSASQDHLCEKCKFCRTRLSLNPSISNPMHLGSSREFL